MDDPNSMLMTIRDVVDVAMKGKSDAEQALALRRARNWVERDVFPVPSLPRKWSTAAHEYEPHAWPWLVLGLELAVMMDAALAKPAMAELHRQALARPELWKAALLDRRSVVAVITPTAPYVSLGSADEIARTFKNAPSFPVTTTIRLDHVFRCLAMTPDEVGAALAAMRAQAKRLPLIPQKKILVRAEREALVPA